MGKVQSHLGEIIGGSSPEEARVLFVESLALFRSINEPFREATALRQLGLNAAQRGDLGQALEFHTRALEIWRNIGHPWGVTISLRALAEVALAQGELETARLRYRESLGLWRDLGERLHMSECFSGLARVALGTGQAAEAVQLLGAQSRLDEEMGYGHPGKRQDQLLADAKAALDPVQYELYWNEGRQMTLDDVLDMVIAGSPA
jgi:tetratricopeptide (TPR) repeat protein